MRVVGPTPAMPQRAERTGCVDRVYWSISSRQDGPPQWRAKVVFARAYRKPAGTTITYCVPVTALEPAQPDTDDAVRTVLSRVVLGLAAPGPPMGPSVAVGATVRIDGSAPA